MKQASVMFGAVIEGRAWRVRGRVSLLTDQPGSPAAVEVTLESLPAAGKHHVELTEHDAVDRFGASTTNGLLEIVENAARDAFRLREG